MPFKIGQNNISTIFLLVGIISAAAAGGAILWIKLEKKRKENRQKYTDFVPAGKVHQLFIHPIKSCKANKVEWLDCGVRGSRYGEERDRQFLLVDSLRDNLFIRARLYPKMVLIEAHLEEGKLMVKFPSAAENGNPSLLVVVTISLDEVQKREEKRRARLYFDERIDGLDCGDEIGRAFDEFLEAKGKRAFRLIWFANEEMYTERDEVQKREHWINYPLPSVEDKLFYHDCASYMGFSLASLDDLNRHLAKQGAQPVDARNFRPNLVLSGLPPFDEDCWLRIRAGTAEFVCYKPCMRCVLTTIDPDSGVKNEKMEPIRELKKYRQAPQIMTDECKDHPVFGVNMGITKPGRVQVGDPVWIQYRPRPF